MLSDSLVAVYFLSLVALDVALAALNCYLWRCCYLATDQTGLGLLILALWPVLIADVCGRWGEHLPQHLMRHLHFSWLKMFCFTTLCIMHVAELFPGHVKWQQMTNGLRHWILPVTYLVLLAVHLISLTSNPWLLTRMSLLLNRPTALL